MQGLLRGGQGSGTDGNEQSMVQAIPKLRPC